MLRPVQKVTRLQPLTHDELRTIAEALAQYTENADETGEIDAARVTDAEHLLEEVELELLVRAGVEPRRR
jgi:ClpP class serine protease